MTLKGELEIGHADTLATGRTTTTAVLHTKDGPVTLTAVELSPSLHGRRATVTGKRAGSVLRVTRLNTRTLHAATSGEPTVSKLGRGLR